MKRARFDTKHSWIDRSLTAAWGIALLIALLIAALPAFASGGGNNKGAAEGINYIPLTPALVVNYGGPGKSRYIKAELSIRSENAQDAQIVMHNLPLIRDRLVSILSAQTDEVVSSTEGKEYLRLYALSEINKALLQVQGLAPITASSIPAATSAKASTTPATTSATSTTSTTTASAPTTSSLPMVMPVKGPASDLYFNNFVVQK